MTKRRIWLIHSGTDGEGHSDFMTKPWISLGWKRVRDLRSLKKDRRAFIAAIKKHYPNGSAASVRMQAGALYRFLYKVQLEDFVIYPAPDGLVYLGSVKGDYKFRPQRDQAHHHVRKIRWFDQMKKEDLPLRVRLAIDRSARSSLCQPRKYSQLLRNTLLTKKLREIGA